ncbi:MAG: hypothetical protein M1826_002224 [Phylliscum demangeonii]|nr:MAG: hypothetical protein M1826_002224 [Phylliscum demangeonii]
MPFGGQQAQPAIPGVTIDLSNIRTTTRFTDLHESLQKELEQLDGMILAQMNCYKQCQAMIPSHAEKLGYLPNDVDHVTRRLETVKESQVNDAQVIERVRATVKDDSEDAKLAFAEVDNERLQPQYRTKSLWSVGLGVGSSAYLSGAGLVDFGALAGGFGAEQGHAAELRNLVAFFSNRADHMTQTINTYRHTLSEIESHVRTVEARTGQEIQHFVSTRELHGSQSSAEDQIRELAVVLRDFENGILGVAGKVGAAREGMQRLLLDTADGGADGLNGGMEKQDPREKEPSLLQYARFYGMTRNHLAFHPLKSPCFVDIITRGGSDDDGTKDDVHDATGDPNNVDNWLVHRDKVATHEVREKLSAGRDAARLLASVAASLRHQQTEDDEPAVCMDSEGPYASYKRLKHLRIDEPLLPPDVEMDMRPLGPRRALDLSPAALGLTLEDVDEGKDEALGWPAGILDTHARLDAGCSPAAETELLLDLADSAAAAGKTEERILTDDKTMSCFRGLEWPGMEQEERELRWTPFPLSMGAVAEETLDGDEDSSEPPLFVEKNSIVDDGIDGSALLWKPEGLRLLKVMDEEEMENGDGHLQPSGPSAEETKLKSIVMKRKFQLDDEENEATSIASVRDMDKGTIDGVDDGTRNQKATQHARRIEQLVPAIDLIERDFGAGQGFRLRGGLEHEAVVAAAGAPGDEADILLSPGTGLVWTTLQRIKQRPLPGQKVLLGGIRERIECIHRRYERLIVLVSEGQVDCASAEKPVMGDETGTQTSCSTSILDESDCNALVGLMRFGASLIHETHVEIRQKKPRQQWEVFLRRAGLNSFAAQVVLARLRPPSLQVPSSPSLLPVSSPTTTSKWASSTTGMPRGLAAFVKMSAAARIKEFESLLEQERKDDRDVDGICRNYDTDELHPQTNRPRSRVDYGPAVFGSKLHTFKLLSVDLTARSLIDEPLSLLSSSPRKVGFRRWPEQVAATVPDG